MKTWAAEIQDHISNWSRRLPDRPWWPRYVYHFTDVHNAAVVLTEGKLYSRALATQLGLMLSDNASPEIISNTRAQHTRYARLYFRPRTPTQYCNEGLRPVGRRDRDAHCPMPVFLCFDAYTILASDATFFSNGNMGSGRAQFDGSREFFHSIPFHYVFHDGRFDPSERDEIVFRRNAEVLVPDCLATEGSLRSIVVRSAAESQTLLHLLGAASAKKWRSHVRLDVNNFFERKWTFVEEVVVVDNDIRFRFNPNSLTPGPFHVEFEYQEAGSRNRYTWAGTQRDLRQVLGFRISSAYAGVARLTLDGAVAFHAHLTFDDLPF